MADSLFARYSRPVGLSPAGTQRTRQQRTNSPRTIVRGPTPKNVAAILGHASAKFTIEVYTHTTVASRSAAIARMDEAPA